MTGPAGQPVDPDYLEYLRDESRLSGTAERIYFPTSTEELQAVLRGCHAAGVPLTVQGGRTGIAGGAVPRGGAILNLSRMRGILGLREGEAAGLLSLSVQPGLPLAALNETLAGGEGAAAIPAERALLEELRRPPGWCFPPDPTEPSATLGGMAASNASGARSFRYGPTRCYVRSLRLALASGDTLLLRRGEHLARGGSFRLRTEEGGEIAGELPGYRMPETKNAAGFFVQPGMDLVDLAVGSEGTLGVIAELELLLIPRPARITGIVAFFASETGALELTARLRDERSPARPPAGLPPPAAAVAALELFDRGSLRLLAAEREANPAFADLPSIPAGADTALYVEIHAAGQEQGEEAVERAAVALEECGGRLEDTWVAETAPEVERMKEFRHAVPEAVNLTIDRRRRAEPGLTKLGTDMAVPGERLRELLRLYRRDLERAGLEHVIFGHVGDNHLHVNVLPRSLREYQQGRSLYRSWAQAAVGMGGTVSAEHGVGKLKVDLLRLMYGPEGIAQMRRLVEAFNPGFLLNRGNMVGL